jgi:hypothetical protein
VEVYGKFGYFSSLLGLIFGSWKFGSFGVNIL